MAGNMSGLFLRMYCVHLNHSLPYIFPGFQYIELNVSAYNNLV